MIVGLFQILYINDDLPDWPSSPEIWAKLLLVVLFGVLQQFCMLGKDDDVFKMCTAT